MVRPAVKRPCLIPQNILWIPGISSIGCVPLPAFRRFTDIEGGKAALIERHQTRLDNDDDTPRAPMYWAMFSRSFLAMTMALVVGFSVIGGIRIT